MNLVFTKFDALFFKNLQTTTNTEIKIFLRFKITEKIIQRIFVDLKLCYLLYELKNHCLKSEVFIFFIHSLRKSPSFISVFYMTKYGNRKCEVRMHTYYQWQWTS